ncbi:MAG TPA: pilus assembly protein PilM [Anaeromyxobacteraceae bacterium]|jgi:general secretion pathway protein L|nr:pilus assembly protein PilM [Anaeromyxobacteraceae bacterium]
MAQQILGLDIGATEVRAVLLEGSFRGQAVTAAAAAPIAPAAEGAEAPDLLARQAEAVKALLAEQGWTFDTALVALPGAAASTHTLTLPFTDLRRIEQTIGFEVEGQIPFDLALAAWDWQPLEQREGRTDLLVAVARHEQLGGLLAALAGAGVDPRAVLPPAVAYASLFSGALNPAPGETVPWAEGAPSGEQPPSPAEALIDLDAGRASVALVQGGTLQAGRTFALGGGDPVRALVRELRATVRAWRARLGPGAHPVARLHLAGAAARLPGLAQALAPEVDGAVGSLSLAPWASARLPQGAASDFALALALALRGHQGARAGRLNLRRGDLSYTRDFEHLRGRVTRLGVYAALVLALALVSAVVKVVALSHQEALLDAALCDTTQKVVGRCLDNFETAEAVLKGRGTPAAAIPRISAVGVLAELEQRAPDVPMKLERIEITREKLHLQGTTDAAENVDKIVTGLRGSRCFGDARSGGARKRSGDGKFEFSVDSDLTCDTSAQGGRG